MLELVDDALEAFFRATVPLAARDVDVSFEAPDREWSGKLSRPTVNVFLWDIRRSVDRARSGIEQVERDGQLVHRPALPRVELRYAVTVWTSDHGDERSLVSGAMRSLLAFDTIPTSFVPSGLSDLPPMALLMTRTGSDAGDAFRTLDGQLKVAIDMVVVAAVDVGVFTPAGPPVERLDVRVAGVDGNDHRSLPARRVAGEILDPAAVGATVVSPRGAATVNAAGRFVIRAEEGDELVVDTNPPRRVTVPPAGGVRLG